MANDPTATGQTSGAGSTDSTTTSATAHHHNHMTVEDWARAVLHGLGIDPTHQNIHWMTAWAAAEGGHWNNTAHYNPINTTESMPGATSMNSVGVKSYKSWAQGIKATIKTLENGNYQPILHALSGNDGATFANAVVNSPWGTHQLNIGGNYSSYGKTAGYGGGGVYTAGGTGNSGLSQDIGPANIRQGLNAMGFASKLINSNKSLRQAFEHIVGMKLDLTSSAGVARAKQIIQNTPWWQNHSQAQRQFDELRYSDPKTFQKNIEDARATLQSEATGLGLHVDPADLEHLARMSVRNGLNSDEINHALAHDFTFNPQAGYQGTIGQTIDQIRNLADSYYVPITNHQIQHYTRQVISGGMDPGSLQNVFQQQALSLYPYLKEQIQGQGQTVAQIADPYKQMMANTLELDPNAIKNNDPLVLGALQSKDENGNLGIMPLYQYQQKLYDDPRWLHTNNARQSLLSTTGSLLQKMGLIT